MPRLWARVTDEAKSRWEDAAKANGMSSAALLNAVVTEALKSLDPAPEGAAGQGEKVDEYRVQRGRLEIRFRKEEREDLEEVAKRFAMKPTQWVVSLVRANLYLQPRPSDDEMAALIRSNGELMAIGRNLNQIAHNLNKEARLKPGSGLEQLMESIREKIHAHFRDVDALVKAADNRWRPGKGG